MLSKTTLEPEVPETPQRGFFGHPRMLANLFSVELWERFSFYGMQASVALYIYFSVAEGGLGLPKELSPIIVGAYGGFVYLSTIFGAWISDRLLGSEKVLFYSAIVVMLGHIALAALPGGAGLAAGLILVSLGSGGVKATATNLVGSLYAEKDERRDGGFSIFYMGVNIGALIGPFIVGFLRETWGFHAGFGVAALGMLIGVVQYGLTRKNLPQAANTVPNPLPKNHYLRWVGIVVAALVILAILLLTGVINLHNLATVMGIVGAGAAVAYFAVVLSSKKISSTERSRVFSFIPLFISSVAFWTLFQQQFTFFPMYASQRLDRQLGSFTVPEEWVNSINPVFIIIFAGIFGAMWTKLGKRQPSTPLKFSISLAIMGVAYLFFLPYVHAANGTVPINGLVWILFLFTMAELMISPVGLSLSTKLAPKQFKTQMVALYYLSVSVGSTLAGVAVKFYDANNEAPYFWTIGIVSVVLGIALFCSIKPIRKLMAGVH